MPVLNGLEASKELTRIMPTVPIILFSQYADVGNGLIAVADLQVDRIVSKADVRNLIEHVRSLIPV
jgi:CheY-like chemotaxis protein